MSTNKIIGGIAVLALILSGLALFSSHASQSQSGQSFGALGGSGAAGTLSPSGTYVYPNPSNFDYLRGNALESELVFNFGGFSTTTGTTNAGIVEVPTISTCSAGTYAASSTLFAVLNPLGATSTVQLVRAVVGGNATTSSLLIGTSTKSTGLASTDVSASLVNSTNGIATSSVQWASSGNTAAAGSGYIGGAGTNEFILVKPGEYVVGYSTTTATGAGANAYAPGFTTCNYKLLWQSL